MPTREDGGRGVLLLAAVLFCWTGITTSQADVVLDGTMGGLSGPLPGPAFMIEAADGRTVGTNLFHSFSAFNINSTQSATFTGPASIENVLGRVTGGSASTIDGLVRSTIPAANLFLLNPAGIMFGPNAALDVQGSFHASTGDYIGLADGTQFTALPSAQDALLTTAAPVAFGFLGSNPGAIDINDSVLAVPTGQTLSLVGGDISITGSSEGLPPDLIDGTPGDPVVIAAAGGRIDLVSVASAGEATFTSPLNADGFSDYGNILIKDSVLSASADTSGEIYIRGGEIVVDSASVLSDTVSGDGGDITLKANSVLARRDEIRVLSGENVPRIRAGTSGAGDGGSVRIEAESLTVDGGIYIQTDTVGPGQGGDMRVDVDRLEMRGTGFIFTSTDGPAQGGDFHLNADSVLIFHGVASRRDTGFSTETGFGNPDAGDAGDMLVTARTVEVEGSDADFALSITGGQGRAGDVVVNAESVVLRQGARIFNDTEGGASGDAGDIDLHVGRLEVRSGSIVLNGSFAEGDGGDINIDANSILISDDGVLISSTGILSFAGFGTGDGGDVNINAGSIEIRGGKISADAFTPGVVGGNVTIAVDSLLLDGGGNIFPRTLETPTLENCACLTVDTTRITASAPFDFSGPAGDIAITANTVTVRGAAAIEAVTGGTSPGGTITLQANTVVVETDARIDTGSVGPGPGGSVILSAQDLTLASGGSVTASSTGSGLAGDINISLTDSFQSDGGLVTTEALAADGGNITLKAPNLVHLTNSSIATSVEGGAGAGGNISIDPQFVILNNSNIIANAFGGPGGNITIVADNFIPSADSVVQASSQLGLQGAIVIASPENDVAAGIAQLPQQIVDVSGLLPEHCAARRTGAQSSFTVAGRGGLPPDPDGYLPSFNSGVVLPTGSADGSSAASQAALQNVKQIVLAMPGWACTR